MCVLARPPPHAPCTAACAANTAAPGWPCAALERHAALPGCWCWCCSRLCGCRFTRAGRLRLVEQLGRMSRLHVREHDGN